MGIIVIRVAHGGEGVSTLADAQAEVRRLVSTGQKTDIEVVIAPGDYHLADPLRFGPSDGGSDSCHIRFRAEEAATVRFSGGRRIADWSRAADGAYSTRPTPRQWLSSSHGDAPR